MIRLYIPILFIILVLISACNISSSVQLPDAGESLLNEPPVSTSVVEYSRTLLTTTMDQPVEPIPITHLSNAQGVLVLQCYDTEIGPNPNTFGSVLIEYQSGDGTIDTDYYADECGMQNGKTGIVEVHCQDNQHVLNFYECPDGCDFGACN